jgi:hypothetical protein
MLYNVPDLSASNAAILPEATGVSYNDLAVPSASVAGQVPLKASFSRLAGHYEGIILNNSGNGSIAGTIYVMFVEAGATAPTANSVLQSGTPVPPYGAFLEIPKNANLDIYLITSSGTTISAEGIYIKRSF